MSTDKKSYFLKLNPPRSTFMIDMTEAERSIMQKHIAYWAPKNSLTSLLRRIRLTE